MNHVQRICAAIEATKAVVPGYFQSTLKSRLSGTGVGSVFLDIKTVEEAEQKIKSADWSLFQSFSNAVSPGCTAFSAPLPGLLGIVPLESLSKTATVTLDDRKSTGMVSCTVPGVLGKRVEFSVCILGMEKVPATAEVLAVPAVEELRDEGGNILRPASPAIEAKAAVPEHEVEVCFTVHPGEPCRESKVPAEGLHGKSITVQQALDMGLHTAKIV
jgi:hypothetical protein